MLLIGGCRTESVLSETESRSVNRALLSVYDVVTGDLGRILASVSEGNIEPIKEIIENQKINEYVRSAALEALLVLVAQAVISREQVIQYYAELFSNIGREEYDYTHKC